MHVHGTSRIKENGHLEIGGIDAVTLANTYGTPLYVYDVPHIRTMANAFKQAYVDNNITGKIAYASKAFSCLAMVELIEEEGLHLDVVSGGELYTALSAQFPPEKIHFHGNNKSEAEIDMAVRAGIGCFVVDNFLELSIIERIAKQYDKTIPILLRVTPGVEAHTHQYISTGGEDSKFGFDLNHGSALKALELVIRTDCFDLLGFHCHIGSQIFEPNAFRMTIEKIFSFWDQAYPITNYIPNVLNVGGGFGIHYTEEDVPKTPETYVKTIAETVNREASERNIPIPEIWIEPGRSIVGNAGTTLYTVGSQKEVPIRHFVAIDGGMTDNLRPALYGANYAFMLANKANQQADHTVAIAGKCCESGDMLQWDVALPNAAAGDILAMFSTGAYGYAMANNYNRLPKPAVVFVEDGEAQLVVHRETYEDLIRHDRHWNK